MATSSNARKQTTISREEVKARIVNGQTLVIVDGFVLRVDAWLRYHPGGDMAILHMVGRDATDEVNALHSADARKQMERYRIGRIEGPWVNCLPPIQGGKLDEPVHNPVAEPESDEEGRESDSSDTSAGETPAIFDTPDHLSSVHRKRRGRRSDSPESYTSVTSMSSSEAEVSPPAPKLGHMDARTQKEIELDLQKYPSLSSETQKDIVQKYRELGKRIRAEGLFDCPYSAYAYEVTRYILFFSAFLYFLRAGWYKLAGVFLGFFWHQIVFSAHDAGHMGITHDFKTDTVIGIFIADFVGGLSLGWWKRSHNVHHIVTNSPEHDPDIELMPFFAISHRFFQSLHSTYYDRIMVFDAAARFLVRFQNYLYYPVLTLGRFNLYLLSWDYLLRGQGPRKGPAWWQRWFEIVGHVFFWSWFGYGVLYNSIPTFWDRFWFVMISHGITMPLHVQITLSHFAMSTADLGVHESFPQKMLRTTMDINCPAWLDFFHGGLQFQAVHHLFPRLPRHNLRKAQVLVKAFCEDVGIPYALYGFVDGNKEVVGHLGEVGRQASILAECQRKIVSEGGVGH